MLLPYQPQLAYYLLDEGAYNDHQLAEVKNAISAIFNFENARTIETANPDERDKWPYQQNFFKKNKKFCYKALKSPFAVW